MKLWGKNVCKKRFFFFNTLMVAVSKHKAARCRRLSRWHTFPSAHTGGPWAWSNVWRADAAADTRFIWLSFSAEPAAGARHESAGNDSLLASCSGRCYSLRCRDEPSRRTQIGLACSQRYKYSQSFHFFGEQHNVVCIMRGVFAQRLLKITHE